MLEELASNPNYFEKQKTHTNNIQIPLLKKQVVNLRALYFQTDLISSLRRYQLEIVIRVPATETA